VYVYCSNSGAEWNCVCTKAFEKCKLNAMVAYVCVCVRERKRESSVHTHIPSIQANNKENRSTRILIIKTHIRTPNITRVRGVCVCVCVCVFVRFLVLSVILAVLYVCSFGGWSSREVDLFLVFVFPKSTLVLYLCVCVVWVHTH